MMSEENIRKQIALPWVSFGSDAASMAPEGAVHSSRPRTRAPTATSPGCSASTSATRRSSRCQEAVRRLSGLPATNLGLDRRGFIKRGHVRRRGRLRSRRRSPTARRSSKPHQYAVGMRHVFVNGAQVLKDGEHTGAKPGRALWGAGRNRGLCGSGSEFGSQDQASGSGVETRRWIASQSADRRMPDRPIA